MPAPDYGDDFRSGPIASPSGGDKIYTVLLIIAAACFFLAILVSYLEYQEYSSTGQAVAADVVE